jgi:hypothetical protein
VTLLVLPNLSPFEFLSCQSVRGGTECSGSINPLYSLTYVVSIAGGLLLFVGLFGASFVRRPLFLFGFILVELGFGPVIFGFLASEWCSSQPMISCVTTSAAGFLSFVALGSLSIAIQTYRHLGLR